MSAGTVAATTVKVVQPGQGRRGELMPGVGVIFKIDGADSGGALAVVEHLFEVGALVPPHVHHREDESFYVLQGEFEFVVEGRTISAGVGSLIYVPRGNLHAHKIVGDKPGRMLVSQTPGGSHERFFEEVGNPAGGKAGSHFLENQPDVADIVAIAAKYGIEILVPMAQ